MAGPATARRTSPSARSPWTSRTAGTAWATPSPSKRRRRYSTPSAFGASTSTACSPDGPSTAGRTTPTASRCSGTSCTSPSRWWATSRRRKSGSATSCPRTGTSFPPGAATTEDGARAPRTGATATAEPSRRAGPCARSSASTSRASPGSRTTATSLSTASRRSCRGCTSATATGTGPDTDPKSRSLATPRNSRTVTTSGTRSPSRRDGATAGSTPCAELTGASRPSRRWTCRRPSTSATSTGWPCTSGCGTLRR